MVHAAVPAARRLLTHSSVPSSTIPIVSRTDASTASDSARRSSSSQAAIGMVLSEWPPPMRTTLSAVRGVVGSGISAMRAVAMPTACAGFGTPNAAHE